MTRKEFEALLEEAFEMGYNDAFNEESGHFRQFRVDVRHKDAHRLPVPKKSFTKYLNKMNDRFKKDNEAFDKYKKGELKNLKKKLKFNHLQNPDRFAMYIDAVRHNKTNTEE